MSTVVHSHFARNWNPEHPRSHRNGDLHSGIRRLTGDRVDIVIESDTEARYLFDRDFSWAPRPPINR